MTPSPHWRRAGTTAVLVPLAVVTSCAVGGTPSSALQTGPHPGAHLVFSDQFNERTLDRAKWMTCFPWAGHSGCTNTDEVEWYQPGHVSVSGGALHLTAQRHVVVADGRRFPFSSGMVASAHAFEFTYGYVEFRARMPKGPGLWSALWLLPADQSWPPEIDVVEVHGNATSDAVLTYHPRNGTPSQAHVATADLSAGWHTYAVDWRPGSITWLLDGKPRFRFTGSVPDQPMYVLMNLAVSKTPPPDRSTPPSASLDVSSVRVWQPG
jgi:beta-glucanase (GH16 family)